MFQVVTISRLVQSYFIIKSGLFHTPFSCQQNGPSTNYSNHRFHNYAGIAQTCSQQQHFVYKVCVGVSSVCYLPVQLSWRGTEQFGSPSWSMCRGEFFVFNHVFVPDPQQALKAHRSARLCATFVFSICCGDVRAGASAWSRAT